MANSKLRHLAKAVTWRVVGTIDTVLLAWIISGDPATGLKIGAAEVVTKMILYYLHERMWYKVNFGIDRFQERRKRQQRELKTSDNIVHQNFKIDLDKRQSLMKQRPLLVWFTGLSGSGKSTMANLLESKLHGEGHKTYLLDGDNVRGGLCKDLRFTEVDRIENIRRIGEVANLFLDAGVVVLCAFVSPFAEDRALVKELVGEDRFVEVFIDCPLEVCEQRDVKGLYKKAREGKIKNFTGIDSPFEKPKNPDLSLKTDKEDNEELLMELYNYVKPKILLNTDV